MDANQKWSAWSEFSLVTLNAGLIQNKFGEFKIAFNKSNSNIQIESDKAISSIQLFNIQGLLIKDEKNTKNLSSIKLNVNMLPSGVYLLKIDNSLSNIIL